jgi:hypothetical protein
MYARALRNPAEHPRIVIDRSWLLRLFFIAQFFVPRYQKQALHLRRERAIRELQERRRTRVTTMIHRPETMNVPWRPDRALHRTSRIRKRSFARSG